MQEPREPREPRKISSSLLGIRQTVTHQTISLPFLAFYKKVFKMSCYVTSTMLATEKTRGCLCLPCNVFNAPMLNVVMRVFRYARCGSFGVFIEQNSNIYPLFKTMYTYPPTSIRCVYCAHVKGIGIFVSKRCLLVWNLNVYMAKPVAPAGRYAHMDMAPLLLGAKDKVIVSDRKTVFYIANAAI